MVALKRSIFVHPFHEEDILGLVDVIGADNVVFGSDYPHPEGLLDPTTSSTSSTACRTRTSARSWAATSTS